MATQPTSDAPFGLQPNVAAGLAYVLGLLGGLIMLFGGGTNRFVKWAAAQSIVLWGGYIVVYIAVSIVISILHLYVLGLLLLLFALVMFVVWIYTSIMGFQGKDIRLPIVADLTQQLFGSQLG